jgi:hypothetical protein
MKEGHWKVKHPELPMEEFAFLKLGGNPNTNIEEYKSLHKRLINEGYGCITQKTECREQVQPAITPKSSSSSRV